MNKIEQIKERRLRHHAALLALANSINPENNLSGLQLWRKLHRLEVMSRNAATAQCNGESYGGQPYRDENEWETFKNGIREKVAAVFGGKLPPALYVNGDPRGHAIKLGSGNGEKTATPFALEQDWGRNQILAPEIDSRTLLPRP